jgi:hypothetical protein
MLLKDLLDVLDSDMEVVIEVYDDGRQGNQVVANDTKYKSVKPYLEREILSISVEDCIKMIIIVDEDNSANNTCN